jgi:hypothetical protein
VHGLRPSGTFGKVVAVVPGAGEEVELCDDFSAIERDFLKKLVAVFALVKSLAAKQCDYVVVGRALEPYCQINVNAAGMRWPGGREKHVWHPATDEHGIVTEGGEKRAYFAEQQPGGLNLIIRLWHRLGKV